MESIEATGATVEEAIAAGMKELGITNPSQVMVEVLQEPDRGIMGHGAKEAQVRLVFMGTRHSDKPPTSIITSPAPQQDMTPIVTSPMVDYREPPDKEAIPPEKADEDARVSKQILEDLLQHMGLDTLRVNIYRSERGGEGSHWILNISGRQVDRLVGHKGETLAALQYITRLIASRQLERRANIVVDAGSYKLQRSDRLRDLALRMADQAVRQQRTVTLEPMPPNERRVIHLTLRKRSDVTTKSVGEGISRKVTISPAR